MHAYDDKENGVGVVIRVVTWYAGSLITCHGIRIRDFGIGIDGKSYMDQDQTF